MDASPRRIAPLRNIFPGELALRDLPDETPQRLASLVTVRLLVLQLAERIAQGAVDPEFLHIELAAVRAYIDPIRERFPADALRLERLLDRLASGDARRVIPALLAAAETTLQHAHQVGAYAFFQAAYEAGRQEDHAAGALSAASRLRALATDMGRAHYAERWDRRARRLLARCR